MLPGEADTAVQLHAFLRGVHRDLRAVRLGQRHRDGASGHVVGQAPGSRAGRQVRAVGDAAKGGLKPVLRGRGHAEAAQGLHVTRL
jgi:hypothetical protein